MKQNLKSTTLILLVISFLHGEIPFTATEMVGRVTDTSATLSIIPDNMLEYFIEYSTESGNYQFRYPAENSLSAFANESIEVVLPGLTSNEKYYYRFVYSEDGGENWIERDEYSFHTQRSKGSTFSFTIISDSHIQKATGNGILRLYNIALENVLNDSPDLHFDLGDAFAVTTLETGDSVGVDSEYLFQRTQMSKIAHSIPINLVLGNHADEEGWNLDDGATTEESKPVLSTNSRKKYFLNPVPNAFFSGDTNSSVTEIDDDHLRESYYSFEWGDALFITLDPFWNTPTKPYDGTQGGEADDEPIGDRWDWTLGEEQYLWLKSVLESSEAQWKFVFAHHVAGGIDDYGRGGAEAAHDYEWGGTSSAFDTHRSDWQFNTSIHQLMVDNGVSVFFHGHDHVYAKEEIGNMVYQECPQPADISYSGGFGTYTENDSTVVINNSGHLRVTVTPDNVDVDYVRAYMPSKGNNGEIAHSYSIEKSSSAIGTNGIANSHTASVVKTGQQSLQLSIPFSQNITCRVYNLMGREIGTLYDGVLSSGTHTLMTSSLALANGSYIAQITGESFIETAKFITVE